MKIIVSILIILSAMYAVWYLVSPAFISSELDEASPLDVADVVEPVFDDAMDEMTEEELDEFHEAVEEMTDVVEMEDEMPGEVGFAEEEASGILSEGEFEPRAHEVEGKAFLINADGETILRFEDFETINGPSLHIYLSSDLGISDAVDLGEIKATKGNINYTVPEGVDLDRYSNVLVWCEPFRVLFSYAELQ